MNKLEREIINTIAEESGIDWDDIKSDSDLYSLGIDSLSVLEILTVLEEKYDIVIKDSDLKNINSVTEIVRLVSSKFGKKRVNSSKDLDE
jgi:acyl carrier protein